MTEMPDDAIVQIEAHELESIFHDLLVNAGIDIQPEYYADAYQSGAEDSTREFYRRVTENADIVIE